MMASAAKREWSALKENAEASAKMTLNADYRSTVLRECVKEPRVSIPKIVKICLFTPSVTKTLRFVCHVNKTLLAIGVKHSKSVTTHTVKLVRLAYVSHVLMINVEDVMNMQLIVH